MSPDVLSWALAQPAGSRAATLAGAYTGGVLRVTMDGRTVEYRSLSDIGVALEALYGAQQEPLLRRPGVTYAAFNRGW